MHASVCNNMLAWCIFFMKSTTFRDGHESFAALLRGCPSPRYSIKRPYFLRLSFSSSRTISGRKRSENRKALSSSVSRRTKRRHDSPSLQNLTNFRSTSTSTSFSREAVAMQNEKRQTRQRTFSSLLLNLLIEDVIVTVLQLRLPSKLYSRGSEV